MTATTTTTVGSRTSDAWRDFAGTHWREQVDVRDLIQANYTPYEGDAGFLRLTREQQLDVISRTFHGPM
ncbi:hypothetical protein E4N62_42515 [Streptomyces sp. MNU76]|uniref:hypothetical protein n=1 Tax=Streptomyces sp. MNU76 TaxID=2560026 RepID=UPI001E30E075|nr:hypothetical protein [Streptomyces sp. MNU76]MCC9711313.1 hypothetical protein [Streptomyces sp. MNU76]